MIIVTLKGGLGNQLFQYACGRALSIRNGDIIKLDTIGYINAKNSDTPREYSLSRFNIIEDIAKPIETASLKNPYGVFSKFYRRIKTKFGFANIEFIPRVLKLKGNVLLDGYWQTEKYFFDQAATIRKEFTLKKPFSPAAQNIANQISAISPSVSLHVRRGDVARDAATNPYYGITTPEYYTRALTYIKEHLHNPHIFVFSDDIEWVKNNVPIDLPVTYVTESTGKNLPDYEELMLMSMCNHNIIANSSFSWWGAWLNVHPDKIVIAPKEWIKRKKWQHKDTVPPTWIRL